MPLDRRQKNDVTALSFAAAPRQRWNSTVSVHPAARVTDLFGHDAGLEGLIAGLAVGAVVAVGIVATGGLGAQSQSARRWRRPVGLGSPER